MIKTMVVYRFGNFVECQIGQLQHIGYNYCVQCILLIGDRLQEWLFSIGQLAIHPAMLWYLFQVISSLRLHHQHMPYQVLTVCRTRKWRTIIGILNHWIAVKSLPCDIKNGIRNLPATTMLRRSCNVAPSKGNAPHTRTYSTTPRLQISDLGPSYSRPRNTSGAAYGGLPQNVFKKMLGEKVLLKPKSANCEERRPTVWTID